MSVTLEMIFNELKKVNKRLEKIECLIVKNGEHRKIQPGKSFRELKELINGIK